MLYSACHVCCWPSHALNKSAPSYVCTINLCLHFMETQGSQTHSQAFLFVPKGIQINPLHATQFPVIHLNIILHLCLGRCVLTFPYQIGVGISAVESNVDVYALMKINAYSCVRNKYLMIISRVINRR